MQVLVLCNDFCKVQMMALTKCVQLLVDTDFLILSEFSAFLFRNSMCCSLSVFYLCNSVTLLTPKDLQIVPTVTTAFSAVTKSNSLVLVPFRSVCVYVFFKSMCFMLAAIF